MTNCSAALNEREMKLHTNTIRTLLFLLSVAVFTSLSSEEAHYPEPVGYVNDYAEVISPDHESRLTQLIAEVEEKTTAEIAIATVKTAHPQPIDMYAVELFTRWGVGKRGKDNGVLIVMALEERQVWIEVGYGLEAVLPDGFCGDVYRQVLVPNFQRSEYGEGLFLATAAISQRIGSEYGVEISGGAETPEVGSRRGPARFLSVVWVIIFLSMMLLVFRRMGLLGLLLFGSASRRGFWTGGTFGGNGGFSGVGRRSWSR